MDEVALRALLERARANNARSGVTGLLLYLGGHFIQVIEGAPDAISQLIGRIRQDKRHQNVSVILARTIEERSFPAWSMGLHKMKLSDLRNRKGFESIQGVRDLEVMTGNEREIFFLMRDFYKKKVGNLG